MNLDSDDRLWLRSLVEDAVVAIVYTLDHKLSHQTAISIFRDKFRPDRATSPTDGGQGPGIAPANTPDT